MDYLEIMGRLSLCIFSPPALRDYVDNRVLFWAAKRGIPHKKEDPPIKKLVCLFQINQALWKSQEI